MNIVDLGPWQEVDTSDWPWPNFTPFELRHRHDDRVYVVESFMDSIQELRTTVGFALPVTSYYRSPEYNSTVSSTGKTGPHTTGRAIDLGVSGRNAYTLLAEAMKMGFTGIGIKQNGPHAGRFIHLDELIHGSRPWVWSY